MSAASEFDWGESLPELVGRRVRLGPMDADDAPALLAIFGDPEVVRYWSSPPLEGLAAARQLVEDIRALFEERTLFEWGIRLAGERSVLGTATLHQWDASHARAELGIALARDVWGRGLAKDALTTLIGFAFERLGLHRLEADIDPANHASLRLFERQGFRREGLLRERWVQGGTYQDAIFLGLLRDEWTPTGS